MNVIIDQSRCTPQGGDARVCQVGLHTAGRQVIYARAQAGTGPGFHTRQRSKRWEWKDGRGIERDTLGISRPNSAPLVGSGQGPSDAGSLIHSRNEGEMQCSPSTQGERSTLAGEGRVQWPRAQRSAASSQAHTAMKVGGLCSMSPAA